MASYMITNISFLEVGDYEFQISFSYDGIIIKTPTIPRTAPKTEVDTVVLDAVRLADQKRSDDNYTTLKNLFDGKATLTVTG